MENFEPIYIDLEIEDGETIACQVLAEYTVDDKDYIALVPVASTMKTISVLSTLTMRNLRLQVRLLTIFWQTKNNRKKA